MTFGNQNQVGFNNPSEIIANVIIIEGTNEGLFVYSGTAGPGNPPILSAVSPGTTTDRYGNTVIPVFTVGNNAGAHVNIDQNGVIYLTNASNSITILLDPALSLIEIIPGGLGTQPSITLSAVAGTDGGFFNYLAGIETNVPISFGSGNSGLPSIGAGTNGGLYLDTAAGLSEAISGALPEDFTLFTITQAALTQCTKTWVIPANDPTDGARYEMDFRGDGTQGTTAQNLTFQISFGGNAALTVPVVFSTTVNPISQAFRFYGMLRARCVTNGSTATWWLELDMTLVNAASNPGTATEGHVLQCNPAVVSAPSNVALDVFAQAMWAATTGAPTLACQSSQLRRIS
jgi:hypothetical protein